MQPTNMPLGTINFFGKVLRTSYYFYRFFPWMVYFIPNLLQLTQQTTKYDQKQRKILETDKQLQHSQIQIYNGNKNLYAGGKYSFSNPVIIIDKNASQKEKDFYLQKSLIHIKNDHQGYLTNQALKVSIAAGTAAAMGFFALLFGHGLYHTYALLHDKAPPILGRVLPLNKKMKNIATGSYKDLNYINANLGDGACRVVFFILVCSCSMDYWNCKYSKKSGNSNF